MKKILYLLPLLLGIFACSAQPQPTQTMADMVNATLTSVEQNNPQGITPQTTSPPIAVEVQPTAIQPQPLPSSSFVSAGSMTYFWPRTLPEGFVLNRENSHADAGGFALEFINPSSGTIYLTGGTEADRYTYCASLENNPSEPVTVRGLEGCFPPSTGGGFSVEWKENGIHYTLGGFGVSKEFALATAEQLESLDLSTFLARLVP